MYARLRSWFKLMTTWRPELEALERPLRPDDSGLYAGRDRLSPLVRRFLTRDVLVHSAIDSGPLRSVHLRDGNAKTRRFFIGIN